MKEIYGKENSDGWTYYIEREFAWFPGYCQGTFVWLRFIYKTWPEKNGKPIMASDVLSKEDMASLNNRDSQMYVVYFPYDPRRRSDSSYQ